MSSFTLYHAACKKTKQMDLLGLLPLRTRFSLISHFSAFNPSNLSYRFIGVWQQEPGAGGGGEGGKRPRLGDGRSTMCGGRSTFDLIPHVLWASPVRPPVSLMAVRETPFPPPRIRRVANGWCERGPCEARAPGGWRSKSMLCKTYAGRGEKDPFSAPTGSLSRPWPRWGILLASRAKALNV